MTDNADQRARGALSADTHRATPPLPLVALDVDIMIHKLLDFKNNPKKPVNYISDTIHQDHSLICVQVFLPECQLRQLCAKTRELFLTQPSLLELRPPLTIVGDIHGQYTDLLRIFDKTGYPPDTNFLFLGDYVDRFVLALITPASCAHGSRGKLSIECVCLLLAYKIKYPETVFLLRGNHEDASINRYVACVCVRGNHEDASINRYVACMCVCVCAWASY